MNKYLPGSVLAFLSVIVSISSHAQTTLAYDQNPSFAVSRDKYMKIADSVNSWHSTTQQETYKAIDWLQDRKEARADRREFRRQLRMQQASWNNYYYPNYNYGRRGYYNNNYYRHNRNFRRHHSFWNIWCW